MNNVSACIRGFLSCWVFFKGGGGVVVAVVVLVVVIVLALRVCFCFCTWVCVRGCAWLCLYVWERGGGGGELFATVTALAEIITSFYPQKVLLVLLNT